MKSIRSKYTLLSIIFLISGLVSFRLSNLPIGAILGILGIILGVMDLDSKKSKWVVGPIAVILGIIIGYLLYLFMFTENI
ncbi:MAG: hypothetical protein WCQ60_02110 [bacterium]